MNECIDVSLYSLAASDLILIDQQTTIFWL